MAGKKKTTKKTAKTASKKLKRGDKVTWKTNGRWGQGKRKGVVKAFIPRNASALAKLPKKDHDKLVGSDTNAFNDRYLIEVNEDGKTFFQTPRSTVFER